MTQSEFNKKWKPHQADYTYPVENLENERFESDLDELFKDELTKFLDFLLKNGYCDTDVYSEPPSAIDRYMHPSLNNQP